jgi:serine/threonine protein kinase
MDQNLKTPPSDAGYVEPAAPLDPHPEGFRPEKLGDFRILGEIGRGGMGVVYKAEQESLGRHVAIKVLGRHLQRGSKHFQRFQREARVAAKLHHTNIVPVFGVGEADGCHYHIQQFIAGVGLDRVLHELRRACGESAADGPAEDPAAAAIACALLSGRLAALGQPAISGLPPGIEPEQQPDGTAGRGPPLAASDETADLGLAVRKAAASRGAPAPPAEVSRPARPRLDPGYWRAVARIGLQVAGALDHAHSQGILHRDIKPANLLLDPQGLVWVTDFGLAKHLDDEGISQTGDVVGTLRYMAPEQLSRAADARSDICSLGLTLYELLVLRPAYAETEPQSLIRALGEGLPPRPRRLRPEVPRDLETIVLKAIAREPAHRYGSAGELLLDLQRFIDDLPVRARRTSPAGRLWRWSKRNRALASTAGAALGLLILLAAVASVAYLKTKKAMEGESRERHRAEVSSQLALGALDRIFEQFAPERALPDSSLSLAGPEAEPESEEIEVPVQPVLSRQAAALLEHLLAFYDRLAEAGRGEPELRRKVAEANRRIGDIRQRLGHFEEARTAYLRALDTYRLLEEHALDAEELAVELARIHNELGSIARARQESGRALHEEALAILEARASQSPASPRLRFELARTCFFLGKGRGGGRGPPGWERPRRDEDDPLRRAIRLLEGLLEENPRLPDYRQLLARCYREMAPARTRGEAAAFEPLARAVAIVEELVDDSPEVPDYRHDLCELYALMEDREAPKRGASLEKALAISEALVADHPQVPAYAASQVHLRRGLADIREKEGKLDEAEGHLRKALALQSSLARRFPEVSSYKLWECGLKESLAVVLRGRGQPQEARFLLENSVAVLAEHIDGAQSQQRPLRALLARCLRSLALVRDDLGDVAGAEEAQRRAEELGTRLQRPAGPGVRAGPPRDARQPSSRAAGGGGVLEE